MRTQSCAAVPLRVLGRMFHLRPLPENESHSERRIRDAVSGKSPNGKARPTLGLDSGTQLPPEVPIGNCAPLWSQIPGCNFRLRTDQPLISHVLKRAIQSCKIADKQPFFGKVHVPKLTKTSYPATVQGRRLPPTDSASKNDVKTRPSTCMVRFWSAFGQLSGKFRLIRFCYPKGGGSS